MISLFEISYIPFIDSLVGIMLPHLVEQEPQMNELVHILRLIAAPNGQNVYQLVLDRVMVILVHHLVVVAVPNLEVENQILHRLVDCT